MSHNTWHDLLYDTGDDRRYETPFDVDRTGRRSEPVDRPRSPWPTYEPAQRPPFPPYEPGVRRDRRSTGGGGSPATRGLAATFASAGTGLGGIAVLTMIMSTWITLVRPDDVNSFFAAPFVGLVIAMYGTVPAALASVIVGAPAGMLVSLSALSRRAWVTPAAGAALALLVVVATIVLLGGWPPLFGLLAAPITAAGLSRWVAWGKQNPPRHLR